MTEGASITETKDATKLSIPRQSSRAGDSPYPSTSDLRLSEDHQQRFLRLLEEIRAHRRDQENHGDDDADSGDGNGDSDDDDDSFDDDDLQDVIGRELGTIYAPISSLDNVVRQTCPICFDNALLYGSPCCAFLCCLSCWRAHISATLNDGRIQVICVANECKKYLPRENLLDFIRGESNLHDRYTKLFVILNQNPRSKTCPRCSHLYSLEPERKKKRSTKKIPKQVQCSECSLVWCFRCQAPWHENLTCKQFLKGDKLLHKWMKKREDDQWNARKCPKCSSYIQRAGGCPHMTCQSCACEFCYSCGRRYHKIPFIGQHSNRLSIFGCPYNLTPDRPWLRRVIRGSIATGVVVVSPLIVVGAGVAAITVLPPVGIYRLVQTIRRRRAARRMASLASPPSFSLNADLQTQFADLINSGQILPEHLELLHRFDFLLDEATNRNNNNEVENPFADMDVENLFTETCSTTPVIPIPCEIEFDPSI